ncbi:MAG TPA: hypothetical protein VGG80_07510 [Acidobacteriaceae bacterium]
MTYAEKLPQILEWVRSHSERLKRKGFEPPNHLAGGSVRIFGKEGPTFDLLLDASGAPPDSTPDFPVYRLEVRGQAEELLFAEDYPAGLTP